MRNAGLEEAQAGIKTAGRNINNLIYADDTTLMAESEEEIGVPFSSGNFSGIVVQLSFKKISSGWGRPPGLGPPRRWHRAARGWVPAPAILNCLWPGESI